ncbi:12425_t:CDS:2 [Racocetra fulgida]|uniref:12425_t:CDS:1 n=1 Tax=Racocetra fulgida TaxID=60492 RepID=A0A9N9GA44_9GLOM|nr:12425_t:CDS:2 [Racocetra fulgida]
MHYIKNIGIEGLGNPFHLKQDGYYVGPRTHAYKVCDEEQVDKLQLQIAKGHHDKKEYEKAWTIFSEIDNCKFRPTHYSSQSHNIFKFTDKFWMTIYILENFYKENTNKIDEKFKDLYLLKKANTCQQRMKYIDEYQK